MSEENGNGTFIKTPWGSIGGKKTAELITILSLVALGVIGYAFWEHKAEAKTNSETLNAVMKDLAVAVREGNCINSYPEAERESKVEVCKLRSR